MEKQNFYFIAITPPKEICDEITQFKLDFAHYYQSQHALKVVPHITLKAPFKLDESLHAGLLQWFQQLQFRTTPFYLDLKNFDAFHNKRNPVVFVKPVMNEQLALLQKEVIKDFHAHYPQINISPTELIFKPHLTIAYRDLQWDQFIKAWNIYKEKQYETGFMVNDFHLFQHDGRQWLVVSS